MAASEMKSVREFVKESLAAVVHGIIWERAEADKQGIDADSGNLPCDCFRE